MEGGGRPNLGDENAEKRQRQALEAVVLDQLVKVDAHQLKDEAQVAAKLKEVPHPHNVVLIVRICPLVQILEHSDLHSCLQACYVIHVSPYCGMEHFHELIVADVFEPYY